VFDCGSIVLGINRVAIKKITNEGGITEVRTVAKANKKTRKKTPPKRGSRLSTHNRATQTALALLASGS
jgi:hypothetical protein